MLVQRKLTYVIMSTFASANIRGSRSIWPPRQTIWLLILQRARMFFQIMVSERGSCIKAEQEIVTLINGHCLWFVCVVIQRTSRQSDPYIIIFSQNFARISFEKNIFFIPTEMKIFKKNIKIWKRNPTPQQFSRITTPIIKSV